MSTEITSAATSAPAATFGTAAKAFVLAHPVGLVIVGSALLGAGAYWGIQRLMSKDATEQPADAAEPATA